METQHLGKRKGEESQAQQQHKPPPGAQELLVSMTRSDLLRQGKRLGILTANPEAIMLEEGAGSCSEPAHQGEQGCSTADNFKRKKFLLNIKVIWLGTQPSGVELKLGKASRYTSPFPGERPARSSA